MQDHVKRFHADLRGVVTSEQVILIVCVMLVAIAAWRTFGVTIVRLISGE
jgi:hypothetical protein